MIPEDMRRFILTSIPSVLHLEALLLLRGDPQGRWDAQRMARRLYVTERKAAEFLSNLAEAGFVIGGKRPSGYQYLPALTAQAEMVDRLADVYSHNLVEITNLIHRRSAHLFADAFRFRF